MAGVLNMKKGSWDLQACIAGSNIINISLAVLIMHTLKGLGSVAM